MNDVFQSKYKVQCKIGEGSFSEVLKCQARDSGHLIAAKRLKKHFKSESEAADIPELIVLRKIAPHPNILQMIDSHYDPVQGRVTLIFELMDMSLYDLLKTRKRSIPEARVKNIIYQILKGLDHLHNHGIFHRDIKPENILIKKELIKLADLGSIRGIYSRQPYTEYISTRWYRSPECLLTTGYYGPKMDIWASGCVFYELLTSKPLFPGANEIDQISKIHAILGTPHIRILSKLRRHKSRNNDVCFPKVTGSGLHILLPFTSDGGREILKQMLVYDPDSRSNVRRLLEHRYFNDLRESHVMLKRYTMTNEAKPALTKSWRNPVLLSFMTTEKRRKINKDGSSTKKLQIQQTSQIKKPILPPIKPVKTMKHPQLNLKPNKVDKLPIISMKRLNTDNSIEIKDTVRESKKKLGTSTKSFVTNRKKLRLPLIPEFVPSNLCR